MKEVGICESFESFNNKSTYALLEDNPAHGYDAYDYVMLSGEIRSLLLRFINQYKSQNTMVV